MKKYDRMWIGFVVGILAPLLLFVIYFSFRDPGLHLTDQIARQAESNVLSYYVSLCTLVNLLLFFMSLKANAERAARGILGATIIYAFTVVIIKVL